MDSHIKFENYIYFSEVEDTDSDSEEDCVNNYEFATELTPEGLALGEQLNKSEMKKGQIVDCSFNRNMHDDNQFYPDFYQQHVDKYVNRTGLDQHITKKDVSCYFE